MFSFLCWRNRGNLLRCSPWEPGRSHGNKTHKSVGKPLSLGFSGVLTFRLVYSSSSSLCFSLDFCVLVLVPAGVSAHEFLLCCDSVNPFVCVSYLGGSSLLSDLTSEGSKKSCWFFTSFGFLLVVALACIKFPGQGSNPYHNRDQSHCSDNIRSLTFWATRELLFSILLVRMKG